MMPSVPARSYQSAREHDALFALHPERHRFPRTDSVDLACFDTLEA